MRVLACCFCRTASEGTSRGKRRHWVIREVFDSIEAKGFPYKTEGLRFFAQIAGDSDMTDRRQNFEMRLLDPNGEPIAGGSWNDVHIVTDRHHCRVVLLATMDIGFNQSGCHIIRLFANDIPIHESALFVDVVSNVLISDR